MIQAFDSTRARSRINRLRRMSFAECAWRAGVVARTTADRLRGGLRAPHWNRRDLEQVLDVKVIDAEMRDAIRREDWRAVQESLRHRLRHRAPTCTLDHSAAQAVREEVLSRWPSAAADASARADRVLRGQYDLLGYRSLTFPREGASVVDWHLDPVHH